MFTLELEISKDTTPLQNLNNGFLVKRVNLGLIYERNLDVNFGRFVVVTTYTYKAKTY